MTKIYHRVTDILSPLTGLSKIDPEILKKAAERGSFVHAVFDAGQVGLGVPEEIEIPKTWQGYIESLNEWLKDKAGSFYPKFPRWFCDKYSFTGECDGIYQDGDHNVLFDLKTSANEGKTWYLQGTAYAYLARKEGIKIDRIEFVRLKKDGKKPCVYTYQEDFDMFLSCLKVYEKFLKASTDKLEIDIEDL